MGSGVVIGVDGLNGGRDEVFALWGSSRIH